MNRAVEFESVRLPQYYTPPQMQNVSRMLQSIMDNIVLCHVAIARPCETTDIQLERIFLPSALFTYPREALLTTTAAGGSPGFVLWLQSKSPIT